MSGGVVCSGQDYTTGRFIFITANPYLGKCWQGDYLFDRSPLIPRIMLVAMTVVFLDAPMWPADSDILPFVLSNASLHCISAVCTSLLSSNSVALAVSPLPTLIKRTCFSIHQQKTSLFNSLLAHVLYYVIFLFNFDSFLYLLMW